MSFLGLYRDPVVAQVTRRCDWRIADIAGEEKPTTLYLVVPPSDISRTKPLIRLILNQIGRRLTEDLHTTNRRHRVLLMLDEFPALGRLDFFESALAFMAGYGLKSFLIAQSLNQIEKAYGANNSILDNCHVRVSFATNDERPAKRVSDALGTATEMRAMKNYAGHRLSPWLGHLMVSRSETARPLMTPGEVMQLPPDDEIVMVAGVPPIRAKKARYFEDWRLAERILPAPKHQERGIKPKPDDWSALAPVQPPASVADAGQRDGIAAPTNVAPRTATRRTIRPMPACAANLASSGTRILRRNPQSRPPMSSILTWTSVTTMPSVSGRSSAMRETSRGRFRWTPARAWSFEMEKKVRLSVYLDPDLMRSLADFAARRDQSRSLIAEAAIASFLSPDSDERREAVIARRLDGIDRRMQRLERDTSIAIETMALFVRFWLSATPPLPEATQAAARAKAGERYDNFLVALGRRLAKGPKLRQEIGEDVQRSS
jgi:Type IV secretory pathway, VirD4 components